jgi:hypothetical protein
VKGSEASKRSVALSSDVPVAAALFRRHFQNPVVTARFICCHGFVLVGVVDYRRADCST